MQKQTIKQKVNPMKDLRNDKIMIFLSPEEILKFIEAANAYDQSLASAVRYLDTKYSEYCRATDEVYRNECLDEQARIKKECEQAASSNYAHAVEQTYNT